jgi:DNA polymerase-1
MECTGIKVDGKQLQSMSQEFSSRLLKIEEKAYELIGEKINLASPKQLAHHFFEKLGYPVIKKTKTGPSTDHSVLETLAKDYELPRVILEHRMLSKLRSTYVNSLQRDINPKTGRVHTSYNQSGTATGRLSSTNPNLQNIPIRTDDGKRIRAAFIPEEGHTLIAGDYSQIELRLLAHFCEDEAFIEAFIQGEDIHSRTAQEILTKGEPPDADARRKAKAINFGIIYGLSGFGLSRQLEIPRREAQEYIDMYFARYPKIRNFLDGCIADATSRGYATTLAGRRRYLPNIMSQNKNLRQASERIAMNTPIQGSAADLIKMAMLKVHSRLQHTEFKAKLLLQVHDELVLEAPNDETDSVVEMLREEMVNVINLKVPLVVDIGTGSSWAQAH